MTESSQGVGSPLVAIAAQPAAFKTEFGGIVKTLGARITNEEPRLYTLYPQHCL